MSEFETRIRQMFSWQAKYGHLSKPFDKDNPSRSLHHGFNGHGSSSDKEPLEGLSYIADTMKSFHDAKIPVGKEMFAEALMMLVEGARGDGIDFDTVCSAAYDMVAVKIHRAYIAGDLCLGRDSSIGAEMPIDELWLIRIGLRPQSAGFRSPAWFYGDGENTGRTICYIQEQDGGRLYCNRELVGRAKNRGELSDLLHGLNAVRGGD